MLQVTKDMPAAKGQRSIFIAWWAVVAGIIIWASSRVFSEPENSPKYQERHGQKPHSPCY